MKIGFPRLRLSRKLLIVTLGITVLLGGTGVTALYFGGKELMLESGESAIGSECIDVQTMVVKTPSNHLWLRRFIRMENASGPDRVRTALRIAGLLSKKNAVDLIHVSVLDAHGPTKRSQMRARSIGAEVLIALKPDNLPEMKSPAMASYYEGPVSDAGRYYGDKVVVDIDEIGAMMTAMRTVEEKPDCVSAVAETDDAAKKNDHGKKDEKKSDHGAKPADHGAKPEEAHGGKPAKDGTDEAAHGEQPAREESFVDSMLSMIGLGGGAEKPAADHAPAAVDGSHAVAEEPSDAAPVRHGDKTAGGHEDKAAAETHESTAKPDAHDAAEKPADATAETHGDEPAGAHDAKAVTDDHKTGETTAAPEAEDHAEPKAKADEHAEMDMPVGD